MEWTALPVGAVVQVPEGIRVIAMDVPRVVEGFMSAIHNIWSGTLQNCRFDKKDRES